jgi:hypothetical protein
LFRHARSPQSGIHSSNLLNWIPACAGMTAFGCHFRVNDGENVPTCRLL